jgi:xylose dehydrogenase (NAD/NADP)
MTDEPLRWGLLSTARINEAVIEPLRTSKRNKLVAVASRNQATADAYAHKHKIEKAHGSYEALLADPEVDVIYNPLPNHMHAEWAVKAVEAGKHVLVEKPIALSVAEMDTIIAAATKHKRVVAEAFMYRHHPQTLKVVEMIQKGELGQVKFVRGCFSAIFNRDPNYRFEPAMGGGALWDVGCYPLSYTRTVLGAEPLEVFAWQVKGETGVDELFTAQMRFPGDIHAQFDCSFFLPFRATMEIVGTNGRIFVPTPFKPGIREQIEVGHASGKNRLVDVKGQALYAGEVEDMADAVLLGKTQRVSLADSRANVAAIQALFESARTGRAVLVK